MYSFSEYFCVLFRLRFVLSSPETPRICVHFAQIFFPLFILIYFFLSLSSFHCIKCKMWPLWLLGHMVRVRRDNLLLVGSVLWWLPAFLKKVILSKEKKKRGELHNCSKWTSEDLLRIKTTLISCFRIQLWPNWGLVGWRYIYYTTLSAQNLLTSRLYRQGKTPCP